MFDPHAHGKGLGLHRHIFMAEHPEGISGAVTDGKNSMVTLHSSPICQHKAGELIAFPQNARDLGAEAHLAT